MFRSPSVPWSAITTVGGVSRRTLDRRDDPGSGGRRVLLRIRGDQHLDVRAIPGNLHRTVGG